MPGFPFMGAASNFLKVGDLTPSRRQEGAMRSGSLCSTAALQRD